MILSIIETTRATNFWSLTNSWLLLNLDNLAELGEINFTGKLLLNYLLNLFYSILFYIASDDARA